MASHSEHLRILKEKDILLDAKISFSEKKLGDVLQKTNIIYLKERDILQDTRNASIQNKVLKLVLKFTSQDCK